MLSKVFGSIHLLVTREIMSHHPVSAFIRPSNAFCPLRPHPIAIVHRQHHMLCDERPVKWKKGILTWKYSAAHRHLSPALKTSVANLPFF